MEKIRLELDELQVESFATDAPQEERGTVRGEDASGVNCGTTRIGGCFCTERCS